NFFFKKKKKIKMRYYHPLISPTNDIYLKTFKYAVFEDFIIRTFVDENINPSVVIEYFSVDRNSQQQLSWLKQGETKVPLPESISLNLQAFLCCCYIR